MDPPENCEAWANAIEAGEEKHRRIVANVRKDPCVPGRVASEFFRQLADQGPPSDAEDALWKAYNIVREAPDQFVCRGRQVPKTMFTMLFRLEDVSCLRYRVPGALDSMGLSDKHILADLPEEELRTLCDEYDGPVDLGNPLQVVWVTDYNKVRALTNDPAALSDMLGRPTAAEDTRSILCCYNRVDTGQTLHVPRVLDAIDRAEFEVNENCLADYGKTRPLSKPPEEGLPEAVHRRCTLTPQLWELRNSE